RGLLELDQQHLVRLRRDRADRSHHLQLDRLQYRLRLYRQLPALLLRAVGGGSEPQPGAPGRAWRDPAAPLKRWCVKAHTPLGFVLVLAACGGRVVVDGAGGAGGAGGAPGTTTTGTTPAPCATHDDCPGGLCIFSTGTCAEPCQPDACPSCSPGKVCE